MRALVRNMLSGLLARTRQFNVLVVVSIFVLAFAADGAFSATLNVVVDISRQAMTVNHAGLQRYNWKVSTARPGYHTPLGTFRPRRLERVWYSRKYDNSPMPHSIFFLGGYAIHGTRETGRLGRPVSHGCIRLHPANAQVLFNLVRQSGMGNTRITVKP